MTPIKLGASTIDRRGTPEVPPSAGLNLPERPERECPKAAPAHTAAPESPEPGAAVRHPSDRHRTPRCDRHGDLGRSRVGLPVRAVRPDDPRRTDRTRVRRCDAFLVDPGERREVKLRSYFHMVLLSKPDEADVRIYLGSW